MLIFCVCAVVTSLPWLYCCYHLHWSVKFSFELSLMSGWIDMGVLWLSFWLTGAYMDGMMKFLLRMWSLRAAKIWVWFLLLGALGKTSGAIGWFKLVTPCILLGLLGAMCVSSWETCREELDRLRRIFSNLEFPEHLVDKTISNKLNKFFDPKKLTENKKKTYFCSS